MRETLAHNPAHAAVNKQKNSLFPLGVWLCALSLPYLLNTVWGIPYLLDTSTIWNTAVALVFFVYMLHKAPIKKVTTGEFAFLFIYILSSNCTILFGAGSFASLHLAAAELLMIVLHTKILPSLRVSEPMTEGFFRFLVLFGLLLGFLNLFYNRTSFFSFWRSGNAYATAMHSIMTNKNTWGQLLFPIICVSFFRATQKRSLIRVLQTLFLIYNLFGSYSRTAMLSFFVFVALFLILTGGKHFGRNTTFILLSLFALWQIYRIPGIRAYVHTFFLSETYYSIENRYALWRVGLSEFCKHPVFGQGMGNSPVFLRLAGSTLSEFHNTFIELLVAGGVIRLALILGIVCCAFSASVRLFAEKKQIASFLICYSVAQLVYCSFESFQFFGRSLTTVLSSFLVVALPLLIAGNQETYTVR